jgi:phage terminase large subunit
VAPLDWRSPDYAAVYTERAERLKRIRATPGMLAGLLEFYATHPVEFINDWGMTFDPRNAEIGLPTTVPFLLFPKQAEFVEWVLARWRGREDGLAEKSRDMGVSWLCVAIAVWMWRFQRGTVIGFGSRKEEYVDKLGDPKSLFWKARQFIALLPVEFRPVGYSERLHAPHMRILNPENSSAIVGEAGDNIGRGNRTSIYFKDESAFYERPEAIDAALSQTSNCKIDVSTPNGTGNPFWRKRHGGKVPVFSFHWRDDPRKDADWYAQQCERLDAVIVAQEIDINYDASVSDAFIDGQCVDEAMRTGPGDVRAVGPLVVGIDVARFGDDKSVITFRRGRLVLPQIVLQGADVTQVAARARQEINYLNERPAQIAVDTIGIGAGVADIMRQWFDCVMDVNSAERMSDGQHYNRRAFMWSQMRDWLKGQASLPNDPELKTELSALRYRFKGAEMLIESKDDAKKRGVKSPDRADSLAMTFAHPVQVMSHTGPLQQRVSTV